MPIEKFDQKIIRVLFNSPSLAGKRKACDHRKQTLDRVQGGLRLANQWVRLWVDMPTDPKWRTISRVSGQSISLIIAVFNFLLVGAANATERGRTQANAPNAIEDIASALDEKEDSVRSVIDAMQGRVLDGDFLTGWEKRQPKREDSSAARSKEWRERNRTQPNAKKRPDTDTDKDKEEPIYAHFDAFWNAYPRKKDKAKAMQAWQKIKKEPDVLEKILSALEWQGRSDDWTKDGGKFIPHPSTYLNGRRWEDEKTEASRPLQLVAGYVVK